MKLATSLVLLSSLSTAMAGNTCASKTKESQCNGDCVWDGTNCSDPVAADPVPSLAACTINYKGQSANYDYVGDPCPNPGEECLLETLVRDDDLENYHGVCTLEKCAGAKSSTSNGASSTDDETTVRVTICHRTCSEKNPWVRLTIDEDAWNGNGCGHQEHEIPIECGNGGRTDFSAWGPNEEDYLIYWHGTKQQVATNWTQPENGNKKAQGEIDYWKKWERACPYVLSIKEDPDQRCCDWDSGECCGLPPQEPDPLPGCVQEMGETGSTICEGAEVVKVVDVQGPEGLPSGEDLLYGLEFGTDPAKPTVTFKVDNPFDFDTDMYVRYAKPNSGGIGDYECDGKMNVPGCNPDADSFTAACPPLGDPKHELTVVSVYFVANDSLLGSPGAVKVEDCCHEDPDSIPDPVVQYTFTLHCGCPMTNEARRLRA